MKTNLNTALAILLAFVCHSSFSQIKSDYDKSINFNNYTYYSFEGWQKNCDKQLSEFDKKRITDAIKSELEERGMEYTITSNADAKITLYVVLLKKTSTTAYTDYTGGYGFRPRWGWGRGAGMYSFETTYDEDDYIEGTLVIDMYDTNNNQLIWQGVITGNVNENAEKREKNIPKKINKLMKKFPKSKVKK